MNIYSFRRIVSVATLVMIIAGVGFAAHGQKAPPVDSEATIVSHDKTSPMTAAPASGEEINWQVISSGGDIGGSSTNFLLSGTAGQTAVGSGGSDNFGLSHGFWQEAVDYGVCGDASGDGSINIADAVYIINYIFKGGPAPEPLCIADADGDDAVNIADAVYIINFVFKGGPPPVEPCCP